MKSLLRQLLVVAIAIAPFAAKADPVEGAPCKDEGSLPDLMAEPPLICTDGAWRTVVFKSAKGIAEPLFYSGKCTFRYREGAKSRATIQLKPGELADVCLPEGWTVHEMAVSDTVRTVLHLPTAMPNVVLLKSHAPVAHIWIYPANQQGKLQEKVSVTILGSHSLSAKR